MTEFKVAVVTRDVQQLTGSNVVHYLCCEDLKHSKA